MLLEQALLSSSKYCLVTIYADDWKSIFGDPTKFLFGLMTVVFHLILLLEHLVYRSNNKSTDEKKSDDEKGVEMSSEKDEKVSSDKHSVDENSVGVSLEEHS